MTHGGGIEALEATTGKPLWHSEIGALSASVETFLMDGKQHGAACVGGGLFMLMLNRGRSRVPAVVDAGDHRNPIRARINRKRGYSPDRKQCEPEPAKPRHRHPGS